MITASTINPTHLSLSSEQSAAQAAGTDFTLRFVAALFLAILIIEALFIAVTAPSSLDVGALYATVT
jgi:hypothetical protein